MTSSEDSISDSLLDKCSMLVSEDGGGGGGGTGTDTVRGGVGSALRNGAGIFILFIKCKTCTYEYRNKYWAKTQRNIFNCLGEKERAGGWSGDRQNYYNLCIKSGNSNKSIYNIGQNVPIGWWVCISVTETDYLN